MENKINVLDFKVANLIAAGEVVERPASAIKELIENSVDAGAKNITVEIQNGGISLMRVTDDGCGMSREDTEMCIRRHATSKIKDASDLAYNNARLPRRGACSYRIGVEAENILKAS